MMKYCSETINIARIKRYRSFRRIIKTYVSLISRWLKILSGQSYYHVPQPIGKCITAGKVGGYYNDFTRKANWDGLSDGNGVPVNLLSNGETVYFPITITQMALGNYDLWLEEKESDKKDTFLKLALWLKENQDQRGGWKNPWRYLRDTTVSDYSALAQGEAISVLVRAHAMTGDRSFIECSKKAYKLMMQPVEQGGCSYYDDDRIYLEEYPENPRSSVLNGWIYAIFGLYDFMIVTNDPNARNVLERTLKTLVYSLNSYDTGYWTLYDQHGTIASPSYHALHIVLLDALIIITDGMIMDTENFHKYSVKWNGYRHNIFNRTKALSVKVLQRLKSPAKVSIVK